MKFHSYLVSWLIFAVFIYSIILLTHEYLDYPISTKVLLDQPKSWPTVNLQHLRSYDYPTKVDLIKILEVNKNEYDIEEFTQWGVNWTNIRSRYQGVQTKLLFPLLFAPVGNASNLFRSIYFTFSKLLPYGPYVRYVHAQKSVLINQIERLFQPYPYATDCFEYSTIRLESRYHCINDCLLKIQTRLGNISETLLITKESYPKVNFTVHINETDMIYCTNICKRKDCHLIDVEARL